MIPWRSKKQNIVTRSSAKVEYSVTAATTCELTWLRQLSQQLKIEDIHETELIRGNQAALYIASNPVSMKQPNT